MNYMQSQINLVDTIYCPTPRPVCTFNKSNGNFTYALFFLQDFDAQGLQE